MSQRGTTSDGSVRVTRNDRIDLLLADIPSIGTRSQAQKLLRAGLVLCNDVVCRKASTLVNVGDVLSWRPMAVSLVVLDGPSSYETLDLLHDDEECCVVNKPAHLTVHPGVATHEPTLLHYVELLFQDRHIPFSPSHTLVHRLDKDTTGCLLIAKSPAAHRLLQQQFADRSVQKSYLALVQGVPVPRDAIIDAPIGRSSRDRTTMSVHQSSHSRAARTTYRTLSTSQDASLLSCDLHTGRTHQLRVHLAAIGHPILGDRTYGSASSIRSSEALKIDTIFLHAQCLSFRNLTGELITVRAPLPSEKIDILRRLQIPIPSSATKDRT